jgi:hypothetical protein
MLFRCLLGTVLLGVSAEALAEDPLSQQPHAEVAIGFMGGVRSYGNAPFAVDGKGGDRAGIEKPFDALPFQDSVVFGPRLEMRVVVTPIRVTVGYQRPYPTWNGLEGTRVTLPDGQAVAASTRGLTVDELRFGLGVEAPLGPVSPFVDLVGDIALSRADLSIDGSPVSYTSESFSLAARGGMRVQTHDVMFVEVAAEAGLVGAHDWSGHLMVGFAFF